MLLPLLLGMALLPAAPAPATGQPDPWMDAALAYARDHIGRADHNGLSTVEARVEGNMLVIVMATPPGFDSSVEDLAATMAISMCQAPAGGGFFAAGDRLRIEYRDGSGAVVSACPERAEATRIMARRIQRRAGTSLGPATLAGARAEGSELVILIDGPSGWRRSLTAERLNAAFFPAYCSNPDARVYFDGTRTVRFDTTEDGGAAQRGVAVASCAAYSSN